MIYGCAKVVINVLMGVPWMLGTVHMKLWCCPLCLDWVSNSVVYGLSHVGWVGLNPSKAMVQVDK